MRCSAFMEFGMLRAEEMETTEKVIKLQTKNVQGRRLFQQGMILAYKGYKVVFEPPIQKQTWQGYEFEGSIKEGAD